MTTIETLDESTAPTADAGIADITFAPYVIDGQLFGPLVVTPTFLIANQPFTLDWTNSNLGDGAADAFTDTFIITSDSDGSEVYRQDFDVAGLVPQQQLAQRASHAGLPEGYYQLIVILNSAGQLRERDLTNNQASYGVHVEAAATNSPGDANDSDTAEGSAANSGDSQSGGETADASFRTPNSDVPILAQPSDNTCWATVATMMTAWHEQQSSGIASVMDRAGAEYRAMFDQDQGLPGDQKMAFLNALGLVAEPPIDYTVAGLRALVENYGALWVTTDEAPDGMFAIHARIITAMSGDGSVDQTFIQVNDPASGQHYRESFGDFMRKFDQVAIDDMQSQADMRIQVVHFP